MFLPRGVFGNADDILADTGVLVKRCLDALKFDSLPPYLDLVVNSAHERGVAILTNCHKALKERGRAILVERVMPDRAKDAPDTIRVDLQMLAVTGGRERGEAEYRALLAAAGLTLTRIIATRCPFSIIEAMSQG